MYTPLDFRQQLHSNLLTYCSAYLSQKGLVRAMVQLRDAAITLCGSPECKPTTLLCFKNRTYGFEEHFLQNNVTTLWLNQNLSHRASSN